MASVLEWVLNVSDNASDKFEKVGKSADDTEGKLRQFGVGAAIAMAAATAAVATFAFDSIDKFQQAEIVQVQFEGALERFPALADTNIGALDALNAKIQETTTFDNEAAAAAETKLAQFDLTGKQIQELMPTIADYATATGQDLPSAADSFGRALLGNTRALKAVGIDYTSTGDQATDLANITELLKSKVSGAAEDMAGTSAGKAQILKNKFEDLQETIGEKLVPILDKLVTAGVAVTDWFAANPAVLNVLLVILGAMAVAFVVLSVAVWAANVALLANPITWIILAIIALIAIIVLLVLNWDQVTKFISDVWAGFIGWITGVINGFASWWGGVWDGITGFFQDAWNNLVMFGVQALINFYVWIKSIGDGISKWWNDLWSNVGQILRSVWNGIGTFFKGVWDGIVGWVKSGVNSVLRAINGIIDGINGVAGPLGKAIGINVRLTRIPYLADGGVVTRPTIAMIGEAGPEAVVPLSKAKSQGVLNDGSSRGGDVYVTLNPQGLLYGTPSELARQLADLFVTQARSGSLHMTDLRNAINSY